MLGLSTALTFGQSAASVTWNLFGADSLSPTTTVGNVTGQTVTHGDTIAVRDMSATIAGSPIPGITHSMRWYPYINGSAVSWGNETAQNNNRWIQFAVVTNSGNSFVADSLSIWLGAGGTTGHIRANLYFSSDPTFATKTLLNPSDTGLVLARDSVKQYSYHVNALVNEGGALYFRVYPWYDTSPSTSKYVYTQYAQIFGKTAPKVSLTDARTMRTSGGDTLVTVSGVVISPNYQTNNRSYYIWDGTDGIDLFGYGTSIIPALNLGDSVAVVGITTTYNGLVEINPYIDSDTTQSVFVVKTGSALPQPEIITVHEFVTNGEKYESHLVGFIGLTKSSGTWPTTSSNKSIYMRDGSGTDSMQVYVDSDTKLYQSAEPTWPMDVIGVGSQYASSGVGGFQLLPRYTTDFLPTGTLPVELSTFTAMVNQKSVILSWQTATETNNAGFDVERSSDGANFQKIAFVKGNGNSTQLLTYSYADENLKAGKYSYRLRQIDYSGKSEYSKVVEAEIFSSPTTFSLKQNYPNPFNPSTVIDFTVEKSGLTTLKVYNVIGQEVATLFNGMAVNGQAHTVNFNASRLSSGVYFYQLRQGNQIKIQKMMLLK